MRRRARRDRDRDIDRDMRVARTEETARLIGLLPAKPGETACYRHHATGRKSTDDRLYMQRCVLRDGHLSSSCRWGPEFLPPTEAERVERRIATSMSTPSNVMRESRNGVTTTYSGVSDAEARRQSARTLDAMGYRNYQAARTLDDLGYRNYSRDEHLEDVEDAIEEACRAGVPKDATLTTDGDYVEVLDGTGAVVRRVKIG